MKAKRNAKLARRRRRPLALVTAITLCLAVACGAEVRLVPAQAQDGPGGTGTGGEAAAGSEAATCECPAPTPARKVELARADCVGGFAVFGIFAGDLQFRNRSYDAWLHPTADETLGQQQGRVEWDPEEGLFVRCPIGDEMTATLWGLE